MGWYRCRPSARCCSDASSRPEAGSLQLLADACPTTYTKTCEDSVGVGALHWSLL